MGGKALIWRAMWKVSGWEGFDLGAMWKVSGREGFDLGAMWKVSGWEGFDLEGDVEGEWVGRL